MAQRTAENKLEVHTTTSQDLPKIVRYWVLYLLVEFDVQYNIIGRQGFRSETLPRQLGLTTLIDEEDDMDFDSGLARKAIRSVYREAQKDKGEVPEILMKNVQRIASLVGLSEVDSRIFEFAVLMRTYPTLSETCSKPSNLRTRQLTDRLAALLGLAPEEVYQALRPDSTLARTGLLTLNARGTHGGSLEDRLELISEGVAERLMDAVVEPTDWLRDMVRPGESSHLQWRDYRHLDKSLVVLRPYLRQAIEKRQKGVNIFVYGPPGTGKTQLARLLAQDMGVELFEVTTEDQDNDPIGGRKRVKALCAANSFFANRGAMVLFDEVEEVFTEGESSFTLSRFLRGDREASQSRKGWLNRILESNNLPTIWVANSLYGLDAAIARRFDMVLELPVPPRSHRECIIREAAGDMLNATAVACLAQSDRLAPAVVSKAVGVVQAIRSELNTPASDAVHMLVNNTLQAQGHRVVRPNSPDVLPDCYDPAFIHADVDLAEVAHMLKTARTGRLCLYGPPGTGKTAFGRWLADQLGVPLHVRRASDLLGMYVGESEKNIASAFAEAQADGGVLLIDEVDSFLQNRQGAERSWEVSQVNEMLTQIETFDGIFIASTNLMDQLDPAVQRRFDLKVRFDPLRGSQAAELLTRYVHAQGLPAPDARELSQVQSLNLLTPGDFAAVKRQSRLRPLQTVADWVKALQAECALKPRAKSSGMGFV